MLYGLVSVSMRSASVSWSVSSKKWCTGMSAAVRPSWQALSLFSIYQDLPGLPMALRGSGRLTFLPTS